MEKYIEQLKPLFAQVAEKMGQGAEYGWDIVMRQQLAYGVALAVVAFISLVTLVVIIICIVKSDWDSDDAGPIIFMGLAVGVSFVWCTVAGILRLVNPAYYALQFFINLVK